MKITGEVVIEREATLLFDLGELTAHWSDEEKQALIDDDHEEHDEAREALLENAFDGLTKPVDEDVYIGIKALTIT